MKQLKLAAVIAVAFASAPALAHISYSGRDFGSFSGLVNQTVVIDNQAVSGNYGWADATDADFGDTHHGRGFRLHLDNEAMVTILATAKADATSTSLDGLLPGFSVYSGLVHLPTDDGGLDYDSSPNSLPYLLSLPGPAKEGAWRALNDWKIGNEAEPVSLANLSSLEFKGYAVDGTAANFGPVPGIIGDGVADGSVEGSFKLAAGDYTIFLGGADYTVEALQSPGSYGASLSVTAAAVPEPETYALMVAGLGILSLVARRRNSAKR